MSQAEPLLVTQVWWDGNEVDFVRWTDKSLVFCWKDARETAVHMPRGAVIRLLDKGVLRIEGHQPGWLPARYASRWGAVGERAVDRPPQPAPAVPRRDAEPAPNRRNIILRLIRKLSGVGERGPASATG